MPFHKLMEAMLLSDTLTSETINEWGCVNRLVPVEDVEAPRELAHRIAAGPTRSLVISKRCTGVRSPTTWRPCSTRRPTPPRSFTNTSDRHEGVKSLMENRPPEFTGN